MKRCPECRRDYYDETLLYCLEDGVALVQGSVASFDEPATVILRETPAPGEAATRAQINTIDQTVIRRTKVEAEPRKKTGSIRRLGIAALILVAVTGIGFAIYKFAWQSKPHVSFQTAKFQRLTTTGTASGVAISPDGKYVVHIQDDGGQQSLWTRQVATQSNVQIVAPSAIQYEGLTFSPDGDYIYYTATSQELAQQVLFQVPTLGGTPKRVLGNASESQVSFSPDGKEFAYVRVAQQRDFTLVIANADGTNEREIVAYKNPPESISAPAWSPDGKRIAFRLVNFESNDSTIAEVRIADRVVIPLTNQRWRGIRRLKWLHDGSGLLALAAGHDTEAQIWHVSHPDGEVRQISNDLRGYADMSFATGAGALAVVLSQTQASIWVASVDDPGKARSVTSGSGREDTFPTWTPDGRITYQSDTSLRPDIWIVNQDGSGVKQLTTDPRYDSVPEVSPDGKWILFMSDRTGIMHLWRMNLDGSDQRQLASTPGGEHGGRFSPDGRWIVFRTSLGRWTCWKIAADGSGEPVQITDKYSRAPTVSPYGKLVAYFYREMNAPWRLAIAPFEGGEPTQTFEVPSIPGPTLRWTPDGRAVAYVDTENGISNIVAQPLDGGAPKQLTDFKESRIFSFAYSTDGKQLALSRGTVSNDVVLITNFLGDTK